MQDLNEFNLTGRLTRDLELKQVSGKTIGNFSIAVNNSFRNEKGENVDKVNYFNFTIFDAYATAMEKFLKKGRGVTIHGNLEYNTWEKDGQKQSRISLRPKFIRTDSISELSENKETQSEMPDNIPFEAAPSSDYPKDWDMF